MASDLKPATLEFDSESHFHGLRGSSGLQITSEVKADLRIELSDLNYLGIHLHVASGGHFGVL